MNIFVARLNFRTQEESLRDLFEAYGSVDSTKIIIDHMTGRSKGFGFVEMPNDDEGLAAIAELNESDFEGNQIVVKKATPRGERTDRGGNRGGGGGGGYNRGY